jgi:hypothetical protein
MLVAQPLLIPFLMTVRKELTGCLPQRSLAIRLIHTSLELVVQPAKCTRHVATCMAKNG